MQMMLMLKNKKLLLIVAVSGVFIFSLQFFFLSLSKAHVGFSAIVLPWPSSENTIPPCTRACRTGVAAADFISTAGTADQRRVISFLGERYL